MRILFVVPYVPNLIRVRPFNLIRQLSDRGHEVTVLTTTAGEEEEADAKALAAHCHRVITASVSRWRSGLNCLRALPTRAPLQSAYSWQPELMESLQALTNGQTSEARYDVVHVEHLRGARYGLQLKQIRTSAIPVVWDSVDCISHLFRQAATQSRSRLGRWMTRFELGRTEQFEAKLLHTFDHTLVTSPMDREALLSLNGQKSSPDVSVLQNGVDLDYFAPSTTASRQRATIVTSGKMSYHANVTMTLYLAEEIMPRVWAQQPELELVIVGKDPAPEIQSLRHHPRIRVTGTVPDIRPYLSTATVAVAPVTYGAGIQNKVLEAMACGTPVITSAQAVSAIAATPGHHLLVADDATSFAEAILHLTTDKTRREAVGAAGRAYVECHHDWSRIAMALEGIYVRVKQAFAAYA